MPRYQTVVVYERYDALAIFEQLVAALPGSERAEWERIWRDQIASVIYDIASGRGRARFGEDPGGRPARDGSRVSLSSR